jgi:signal transduction histidine kinase
VGMSHDTIQSAWMEPATIMKKGVKNSPSKFRRYTGEKGIGRFASAKLSSSLQIITRAGIDNEVVVDFNWSDFSDDNKYLDQVESSWEIRKPTYFKNTGTVLHLNNLNSDWDAQKFQELKIALSRLINPVAPIEDFLIELELPSEFNSYSGLIKAPESINSPDYSIKGSVDENGNANLTYYSKKNKTNPLITKDLSKTLSPARQPASGSFNFEFRVWDREKDSLDELAQEIGSTTKNIRADLDQLGGVSVYRDNFRVLPYGEPKNDWLRLNARRVNNPTLRLSDKQIVGYISISLDNNKELKDQSNREGIVDSSSFVDLQDQIKSLLNELEIKRYEERPRKDEEKEGRQNLYSHFNISDLATAVSKRLPDDRELLQIVTNTQESLDKGVKKVQEVLSRYRRLSTLGQLVDSILHDGGHFLLNIDSEVRLLDKEFRKKECDENLIQGYIKSILEQRKIMAQLFKRLEPFGGRKRGKPTNIVVEESIKNAFVISKHDLDQLNIQISLPETQNTFVIDSGELQMILINLLQNSIHWLGTVNYERKITVEVESNEKELAIVFSDNGPGIPENQEKLIFDPYFTTRPDGIGLGLTIVGELVSEYNGDFYLIDSGPLDGACFKIIFRKNT